MAWDLPPVVTLPTDRTSVYFNKFKSCFDVLDQHAHSGQVTGDGPVLDVAAQRIDNEISIAAPRPGAVNNFVLTVGVFGSYLTSAALNDQISFDFAAHYKGTGATSGATAGSILVLVAKTGPDQGQITATVAGVTAEMTDLYAASPGWVSATITRGGVGGRWSDGFYTVTFQVTGKNASSTAFKTTIYALSVQ